MPQTPPERDDRRPAPQILSRVDVIHHLLHGRRRPVYLEVGVRRGDCFCEIRARRKVAVDPLFQIKRHRYWGWKNLLAATYHECTSDEFFARRIDRMPVAAFDVVFLDGLHTYAQSLNDVRNSLRYLKPDGWIVLHDCNPPNAAAASPAESYQDAVARFDLTPSRGAWNGEVWKTIVRLRSEAADLQIVVLDCDEGLALIRRGTPENRLAFTPAGIDALTYADLERDRANLLNLKPAGYLFTMRP